MKKKTPPPKLEAEAHAFVRRYAEAYGFDPDKLWRDHTRSSSNQLQPPPTPVASRGAGDRGSVSRALPGPEPPLKRKRHTEPPRAMHSW
jgi:hypothetical protein